jgi:hypothetical protein
VQTTRSLVRHFIELTTGMQLRHGNFESRCTAWMHVDRNTTTVVGNSHVAIGAHVDRDLMSKANDTFVNRVIDNFFDTVM